LGHLAAAVGDRGIRGELQSIANDLHSITQELASPLESTGDGEEAEAVGEITTSDENTSAIEE
jgi:hypothetical protein